MNSLGVFLGQELVRFNGLIEVMKVTLNDLQRAIKVRIKKHSTPTGPVVASVHRLI